MHTVNLWLVFCLCDVMWSVCLMVRVRKATCLDTRLESHCFWNLCTLCFSLSRTVTTSCIWVCIPSLSTLLELRIPSKYHCKNGGESRARVYPQNWIVACNHGVGRPSRDSGGTISFQISSTVCGILWAVWVSPLTRSWDGRGELGGLDNVGST